MDNCFSGMLFRPLAVAFAVVALSVAGCRRTDVREFEVSIPALTAENETAVRQALARFGGVDKASMKFDFKAKTV